MDSTTLRVCHIRRIGRHRVFAGKAARGQSSTGWFYGFKLHLVVNDQGDILAFHLTAANVDDRQPVPRLATKLFGRLFGDRGYVSTALFQTLFAHGLSSHDPRQYNLKLSIMEVANAQWSTCHKLTSLE